MSGLIDKSGTWNGRRTLARDFGSDGPVAATPDGQDVQ